MRLKCGMRNTLFISMIENYYFSLLASQVDFNYSLKNSYKMASELTGALSLKKFIFITLIDLKKTFFNKNF